MMCVQLTRSVIPATIKRMRENRSQLWRRCLLALSLVAGLVTGGCISVKAPDKPIVIELNINIKQEVVYRLAADAGNTIESNPDIF
jgi:anti-sigma-K factor RskA